MRPGRSMARDLVPVLEVASFVRCADIAKLRRMFKLRRQRGDPLQRLDQQLLEVIETDRIEIWGRRAQIES